ncbi:MAG: HEAT repeat domain-containing protein [candidate division WOR-3 bacterium]
MKSYARDIILLVFVYLISCGMPPKDKALSILRDGIKDKSEVIQVNAAKVMIEIGDKQGYEVIYNILQNGSNDAKVSALGALYSLKERVYSPVIAKLCTDSEPLVRTEAYHLISLSTDTGYYKILVQGTKDRIARVRRYAYQGLANFKDIQNINQGLRDIDPLVRISAARSIGLSGRPEAKDFIKKEMDPKNPNVEIWAQAVLALGELKDTSSIQYIKDLLTDTPWDLKIAAAEALLMLKDDSGVDVLKSGLQSPDPFVRVKVVEIMERYPLPEFYDLLKEACRDEYINVSIGAINALLKYQKKENLKLFENLLKAPNPLVRIASAGAYLRSL